MLTVTPCDRGKHGVSVNESMSGPRSGGAHYGKNAHSVKGIGLKMFSF